MATIHAVFENGVFCPKGPVQLPEACEVEFEPRLVVPDRPASDVVTREPMFISDPHLSVEEFARLLDLMASLSSGQSLPLDFSRADLYDDHD